MINKIKLIMKLLQAELIRGLIVQKQTNGREGSDSQTSRPRGQGRRQTERLRQPGDGVAAASAGAAAPAHHRPIDSCLSFPSDGSKVEAPLASSSSSFSYLYFFSY